ncbi:hypothetical protein, partial [Pseudoalteromonas sp. SMN1298-MNA-CIBAN-0114]
VGDMQQYQQLRFEGNAKGLLEYLWQQAPLSDRQLIQVTQLSVQLGDADSIARVHNELEKQRYNKQLYPAWSLLSNWYQNQNDLNSAYTTLN